ncbi:MAG: hypothetical protein RJA22_188 [Verrucomicrobiota bacterium]
MAAVAENQPRPKNRMTDSLPRLASSVAAFIGNPSTALEDRFGELALALFAFQHEHNAAYRSLCGQAGIEPARVGRWQDIPAAPAAAFKELDLSVLPPGQRTMVFHSSGTTGQTPSRHHHNAVSLGVYHASLLAWAEPHLRLQSSPVCRLLALTPTPTAAPHSSLAHMLGTLAEAHPQAAAAFHGRVNAAGEWDLDVAGLLGSLDAAAAAGEPVAILGTAFQCVHLLDALAAAGVPRPLPPGSRLMETGGYKGRSRVVPKLELHRALAQALGLRAEDIVTEYGMSELGSQAYDAVAGQPGPRTLRFPPWARAMVVSPETGAEVPDGGAGLLRVVDLANVASVVAVQTADLARREGNGFTLLGRAPAAEARGCSLLSMELAPAGAGFRAT